MLIQTDDQALRFLQGFLTPRRRKRFEEILARRTRMLTVVLEDVYQPQNQSAVLRSAEATGLQDVHIVETNHRFDIDPQVSMGCERWLTIHRYPGEEPIRGCLEQLRSEGYRILAASPHAPAVPLTEVTITNKTALIIGNEKTGVSDFALGQADGCVIIPMWGFVESLNLSVAAALCLYHLRSELDRAGLDWQLNEEEADALRLVWARQSIPNVDAIERRFFAT